MPIDWAIILGEAIHDLRSALDQCVYWLTIDWERRELGREAQTKLSRRWMRPRYLASEQVAPLRARLINKGLLYTPRCGYAKFTVPQFDRFIRRHMELDADPPMQG